ncbi:MAG: mechanosensitive ion channel [Flavipsychrobacter sp.]|nr:mechanosensitive ion channel [Flavipsychrobacter sp.]
MKRTSKYLSGLILILWVFALPVTAQQKDSIRKVKGRETPAHAVNPQRVIAKYSQRLKDTIRFSRVIAESHSLVLSDSMLNEIGIDSLLDKLENLHNTLTEINNVTSIGFDTHDIDENIATVDSNVDIIDENLTIYTNVLDVKNLQMFNILLADIQDQVVVWRETLFKYNKKLMDMNAEMTAFKKDTVLRSLFKDSAFIALYGSELNDLRGKWRQAKKNTNAELTQISRLQANVSNLYFEDIDLKNRINDLLRKVSVKNLGKEYEYLWDFKRIQQDDNTQADVLVHRSYRARRKVLGFYFQRNWDDEVWLLVTGFIFMFWVFWNIRKIKNAPNDPDVVQPAYQYITRFAVLPALIVTFTIAPLYDLHPPTTYVEFIELLLVVCLTVMMSKIWPKRVFSYWVVIALLYVIFIVTGTLLTPALGSRLLLLGLNICSVVIGVLWFRAIVKHEMTPVWMVKTVTVIFLVLNVGAILCNIFGRLSLAKIFGVTAIFGLTQIVALSVFINVVMETLQLQTQVNKMSGGLTSKFNYERMLVLFRRILVLLSTAIWTIVFTVSLNIYNILDEVLTSFLTTPRKIGNTSFEIGSILLFAVIIYVSNLLQQGVGSLYGRPDDKWDPEVKKNGSRLAMTRLVLIVLGFLIAVAASGLPIDKITIVLGALGVGIGLGLQSIVNNLVSGVILIFEQPFRIGDYIELGDSKGRVLDIGIRSSKLVKEEGAEIIMPNADLLSGRVINWTLRNENMRVELVFSVAPGHTYDEVRNVVMEVLDSSDEVLKTMPPELLLLSLNDKSMNMKSFVWITDVQRAQSIKSKLLKKIYDAFSAHDIQVV